jgi:hypothetical protein
MVPTQLFADIPTLTDTELRIILIALSNHGRALSIPDMQVRTGRHRQVYEAVKSLESRGLLTRIKADAHGALSWLWSTPYHTPAPTVNANETVEEIPIIVPVPVVEKPKRTRQPKTDKPVVVSPQNHPAVLAYTEVSRRKPSNVIAEQIINEVTDVEKWAATVKEYVLRGWNPMNISGMLKLYKGEMTVSPQGRKVVNLAIPHQAPDEAMRQWERYLQENE